MKNTLLLLLVCAFVAGCKTEENQGSSLTSAQQESLAQFTTIVSTALQAMDASTLYHRGSRALPKAVADEVRDCERKANNDGSGRRIGVVVGGANCPIRASWVQRPSGNNSTLDLSYRADDENFTQILPVAIMTLDGRRITTPFGGRHRTVANYNGSARDTSDDVVTFNVTVDKVADTPDGFMAATEFVYTIRVAFRDFAAEGRIENNQRFYLNGVQISREDFEKLFFIFK